MCEHRWSGPCQRGDDDVQNECQDQAEQVRVSNMATQALSQA
jgi:hypothetical protein